MCVIEIRPGQGGADAAAFARSLRDAVRAWALRSGWQATSRYPAGSRTVTVILAGVPVEAAA